MYVSYLSYFGTFGTAAIKHTLEKYFITEKMCTSQLMTLNFYVWYGILHTE
jgi:hypothetical protein